MKTDKQASRLIVVVLLILFAATASYAQIKTGYLVSVDYKDKMVVRKVKTTEQVEAILSEYFPKSKIDVKEFLKEGVYFEIWGCDMRVYIEMKRINEEGKYKRLSKKQIRQMR